MRTWRNHMEFEVLHMKATLSHGMVGVHAMPTRRRGTLRWTTAGSARQRGAAVRDQRRTFSGAGDGAPAAGAVTASR